ncbi:hypothetical protein [Sphingomonas sp. 2R-10]|uniref:hypothetical protein n=1 Tax=Sphingomonas sp. 2R-10 TaxID=3045148 RepID=UPI0013DE065A|nr:hypothetical protein [Sphingomonas sp. 2R-10]
MSTTAAAILLAGCSPDAGNDEAVDRNAVAPLFSAGFDDAAVSAPATKAAESAGGVLSYRFDPAIRRQIARGLADHRNRNFSLRHAIPDPDGFLRSGDAATIADRALESLGLPLHSVDGATVLLFGLAWELANARPLTPDDQRALLAQIGERFADHALHREDDADRQREAEMRLMTAGMWLEEARLRHGDAAALRELSDAVQRDMLRQSGNDMRAHRIGAQGFTER